MPTSWSAIYSFIVEVFYPGTINKSLRSNLYIKPKLTKLQYGFLSVTIVSLFFNIAAMMGLYKVWQKTITIRDLNVVLAAEKEETYKKFEAIQNDLKALEEKLNNNVCVDLSKESKDKVKKQPTKKPAKPNYVINKLKHIDDSEETIIGN